MLFRSRVEARGNWSVVLSGEGNDRITSSGLASLVFAGSGNDSLDITGQAGIYSGGEGDDSFVIRGGADGKGGLFSQLVGGSGNDLYTIDTRSLAQGDGTQFTYINNQGDAATVDRLLFGGISNAADLSFQQLNSSDLAIGLSGSNRRVVLQNWYGDEAARVDILQIDGGLSLRQADVQSLVQAWQGVSSGLLSQAQWTATSQALWA